MKQAMDFVDFAVRLQIHNLLSPRMYTEARRRFRSIERPSFSERVMMEELDAAMEAMKKAVGKQD